MRINQFVAQSTGLSRRTADNLIKEKRIKINSHLAKLGEKVEADDVIMLDDTRVIYKPTRRTIILHKPAGYVCSRREQGNKTIYDLLPKDLHELKPIGRLDKDSSGLLLLTSDGNLAHKLTHPKFRKQKIYEVSLDKPLEPKDKQKIEKGVRLEDGLSRLKIEVLKNNLKVILYEGRNRQIRRTFKALSYEVKSLHRVKLGNYELGKLPAGTWREIKP